MPHLKQSVLSEINRLLLTVVALVQIGTDSSKLDELVLLEALCECDCVKVVESVNGRTQALVVFLFDEEVDERLVDRLVIVVLHRAEVGLDERNVAGLLEEGDGARVVNARRQDK